MFTNLAVLADLGCPVFFAHFWGVYGVKVWFWFLVLLFAVLPAFRHFVVVDFSPARQLVGGLVPKVLEGNFRPAASALPPGKNLGQRTHPASNQGTKKTPVKNLCKLRKVPGSFLGLHLGLSGGGYLFCCLRLLEIAVINWFGRP